MAQGLAQSRTITALLAAVGTVFAVSAMIGAPIAGECWDPPADGQPLPEPKLTTVHGPPRTPNR